VLGVLVGIGIIQVIVDSPENLYITVAQGVAAGSRAVQHLAIVTTPVLLAAVAVAIPAKLGLWNIGVEGQLFMGAWAAMGVARLAPDLAGPALIPLMVTAAAGMGAIWILIPALARVYVGASEIVTTLMLNFVAMSWINLWLLGGWRDPAQGGSLTSFLIPPQSWLPAEQPFGFYIALAVAVIAWAVLRFTTPGYEVMVAGASERVGAYAGISIRRVQILALLASGAIAGAAGAIEMMGNVHRVSEALSTSYGYTGVVIAVVAGISLLAIPVFAVIFGTIAAAGNVLSVNGINPNTLFALTGLVLLFSAFGEHLARWRLYRDRPVSTTAVPGEIAPGQIQEYRSDPPAASTSQSDGGSLPGGPGR
jgi:simple sugar transport system permease protein